MKKVLVLMLASAFVVACSPAVGTTTAPPTESMGVNKYEPQNVVGHNDYLAFELNKSWASFTEEKMAILPSTIFYINREFFLGKYDKVSLPNTFDHIKEKIYLWNCSIRQC